MLDFQPMLVIEKIAVLFLVLLCGYYVAKRGFFSEDTPRALSLFLVNLTQPAMILHSFQMEFSGEKIRTGFIVLAASVVIHPLLALVARLIWKGEKDPDKNGVLRYASVFFNCSFLGYPVLDAIFGEGVGVFYGTFYCIMFNVFNFTYGIHLVRCGRGKKPKWYKTILNPGVLSTLVGFALYLCRVRLPGVVDSTLKMVGDLTFPLSMVIVGALLASLKLKELFTDRRAYCFCLYKNLLLPLAAVGIAALAAMLGFKGEIPLLLITLVTVPCAATSAIFAESYGSDSAFAARIVGLSTLLSVITLPLFVIFASTIVL